jgi:hypothetical protein
VLGKRRRSANHQFHIYGKPTNQESTRRLSWKQTFSGTIPLS